MTNPTIAAYEALRAEHAEYAAEARACGQEVVPFEEWAGHECPKAKAQERWQDIYDRGEEDLY